MRVSAVTGKSLPQITAQEVAERMLALLPEDGTPVLNRVMRIMLSRALQRPIEPELYFAGRDLLLKKHRIGRLRGQGGQLFLLTDTQSVAPSSRDAEGGMSCYIGAD